MLPFSSREYRPPYLPQPLSIDVGTNSDVVTEPILCHLAFAHQPDRWSRRTPQPASHSAGLHKITGVKLLSPHADCLSPELQSVVDAKLVQVRSGTEYQVVVDFDGQSKGKMKDFRPALPLIVRF
jgi:hypothetical protein